MMSLAHTCPLIPLLLLFLGFPSPNGSENLKINQSPNEIFVGEGGSVRISCSFTVAGDPVGVYLKRRCSKKIAYFQSNGNTFMERNHTELSGNVRNFTITLHQLQRNETDWYLCEGAIRNPSISQMWGTGTLVIVLADAVCDDPLSAKSATEMTHSSTWQLYLLIAFGIIILVLMFGLVILAARQMDLKECFKPKKKSSQNLVYEDMSYSLRRNTMSKPTYYLAS
ncbi:uncharacterized protein LOC115089521 [Rhinatrema bivittatum]|uniref:uncharacterized protein LOC115089521 n=1 Tax=Rhinatrema bivittatum TaxID=194408 RepID=UPI0011288C8A|nr:uncharacterized protein LOC115089521 [Rhinatrema bivittatum]